MIAAAASQDPNHTATIYVHGFEITGADRHGVFGEGIHESLADSVAVLVGLPTSGDSIGPLPPNVVVGTTYYGDMPPPYYTAADLAELDRTTTIWGGGVPRYAYIVAKYARHVLERSGAQQVNFVSASFGSLVVRWLIEKNVDGLAQDGRIARWLTIEGVLGGNWPASHEELVDLLSIFQPAPIDVRHMSYGWIEANLHNPRTDADSPYYAGIMIGQIGSTDDSYQSAALRNAMLAYGDYQPNDGVQALPDTYFHGVAEPARLLGMPPTFGVFHATHLGIAGSRAAWAQAATFLVAARRVTVTMVDARVVKLREPQLPWWDWRPAEVLLESRVYSATAQARWGIAEPLSAHVKEGAAAPLRRYTTAGETQQFQYVIFDDLVLPDETRLRVDLRAVEVDYDLRYGVVETIQTPYYDDMGGGTVVISTVQQGTYAFAAPDWSCTLSVSVFDYPFAPLTGVLDAGAMRSPGALAVSPNPFRANVRIAASASGPAAANERATLEIADVSGRVVRRLEGDLQTVFVWDGRDARGRFLPSGVYLHRIVSPRGIGYGRSCFIR